MELEPLFKEYRTEVERLGIDPEQTDPEALERHLPALRQLASMGNVGITVFDLLKQEHVFCSINFQDLFGYDLDRIATEGNDYFNSRVHPEDHVSLIRSGIAVMRLYHSLPPAERAHYKLINEYRIRNRDGEYVRIIEQHQPLETDGNGQMWLSLGVMDISPVQDGSSATRSCFINFKTGKVMSVDEWAKPSAAANAEHSRVPFKSAANELSPALSPREREILSLIGDGMLSKEISDRLFISIHTVNTHRQRILEKLNADNSMEAVKFARGLGLIGG